MTWLAPKSIIRTSFIKFLLKNFLKIVDYDYKIDNIILFSQYLLIFLSFSFFFLKIKCNFAFGKVFNSEIE
jgi:hypothetical protein